MSTKVSRILLSWGLRQGLYEIPVTGKYHREWQNDILNSFPRTFFVVSQYFANFSAGVSHHSLHSVWPLSPWELIINYAPNGWHHLLLDLSLAQLPTKSIVPFTIIALVSVDSTCWSNLVSMLICGSDGFESRKLHCSWSKMDLWFLESGSKSKILNQVKSN